MTKFDGRTKDSTAKQIDESLERLQTDHIDLMQYHENIRMEDPDRFFAPGALLSSGWPLTVLPPDAVAARVVMAAALGTTPTKR